MKKYKVPWIMGCIVLAILAGMWISGGRKVQAASRASLINGIRAKTKKPILKTYYADYDGEGSKELFAITGKKREGNDIM